MSGFDLASIGFLGIPAGGPPFRLWAEQAGVAASSGRSLELSVSMVHPTETTWNVCSVKDVVEKPLCNNHSVVRQSDTC